MERKVTMKSKIFTTSSRYEGKRSRLNHSLMALSAFTGTLLVTSSVVQATDLQIYAAPTAGKKTIVMMLDTSGSMAEYDNNKCKTKGVESVTNTVPYKRNYCMDSNKKKIAYDRLTRLKDGMFAFLDSDNESLRSVRVGLGNYSAAGDGRSGQILVPAVELGVVDSDQRKALKNALKDLTARNGTPTAHAYAEAASYLMGTNTLSSVNLNNAPIFFYYTTGGWRPTTNYYQCTQWNRAGTSCSSWSSVSSIDTNGLTAKPCTISGDDGTCYHKTGTHLLSNSDSGFTSSVGGTKKTDTNSYESPLPPVADRQSCDGQGVYVLSDGAANSTSETRASTLMSNALGATYGNDFNCEGGLAEGFEGSNPGGWRCMGEFSKRLFDKTQNPAGASIQTAFVGFGNDMDNLANKFVENACRLSSRTQDDRTSDDSCSPTATTAYKTSKPGYGNGGFFIAKESAEITNSVIQFIDNLGKTPINPLSTGAVSVPVDALSPQTYQPYGYLRALEPKPGTQNITWTGNLKKYDIGGGALKNGTNYTFNTDGTLNTNSKDKWNATTLTDGEGITVGGVYSKLKLPTTATTGYRPLFSDIKSVATGGVITTSDKDTDLFSISQSDMTPATLLNKFKNDAKLKNLTLDMQLKLLNYLGHDLPLDTTPLPAALSSPKDPFTSIGASIHSFPVQMTYKGTLDADGNLTSEGTAGARDQSLLYGSSEGALRIVNSSTGEEQMVFVPAEILNSTASKALRKGSSDTSGMTHGISGAWISDSDYTVTSATDTTTSVVAKKMNVYGGMRMGGNSYYGLDVLTPSAPKLLFNIVGGTGSFTRMGQTWSKPVMANIRYGNAIRRVMIVGGGYDMCYENPRFKLGNPVTNVSTDYKDATCNNKTQANGNAVYIIDAKTGERIWWASSSAADTNNTSMTHSIVSRISTLDRDSDGLVDQLYFGDLGGQVFRIDLNNTKNTSTANFGKRIVRLANLGTKADGTTITNGDQPRFYQPPTLTVHDEASSTFVMVGIASGDRSTPLDVSPTVGRELMKPFNVLTSRPNNNVYGLIDRDIGDANLYTVKDSELKTVDLTLKSLFENPQKITTKVSETFFPYAKDGKQGWYRSLSSDQDGTMIPNRAGGGVKAFEEEPVAMTGRLIVPVYDPQGTGLTDRQNPCQPRVVGESNTQQFCLPFGACLNSTTGLVDKVVDALTGFQFKDGKNQNLLGPGIQGITFGPADPSTNPSPNPSKSSCGAITLLGLQQGKGRWECTKILNPIRWYEKYVEAKKS